MTAVANQHSPCSQKFDITTGDDIREIILETRFLALRIAIPVHRQSHTLHFIGYFCIAAA